MQITAHLRKQAEAQKKALLHQLSSDDPLETLFLLAVYFEQQYGRLEPSAMLQEAGISLSKMIKDLFLLKKDYTAIHTAEEAHQKLLKKLVALHEEGFDKTLIELFHTYEYLAGLDTLEQIREYDENCEVKEYAEGCFRTTIKKGRFEHFQNYIKNEQKLKTATEYYTNLGRYLAFEMINQGLVKQKGSDGKDLANSFDILGAQIAAIRCAEHYGIEENFKLKGKEYKTSLIIQIFSFLSVYARSTPSNPLFIDTWESFQDRMSNMIESSSPDEIERHLDLITTRLDGSPRYVNIFERPLLRLGNMVVFFARPLMLQNSWLPVILPLLKNIHGKIEPEGKGERVRRSTANLAKKFQQQDFVVLVDEKLPNPKEPGRILTDVDVIAMKDNWLVILQVKMTHPRASLQEAANHKIQLEKAGRDQMVKTMGYLEENWTEFRNKLDSGKEWREMNILPLVVSTSFEFDRERFSGYLKISQFELERYLDNDACFLHLAPEDLLDTPGCERELLYYPPNEKLFGALLYDLVQSDALWRFLDQSVVEKDLDPLLPEGCLTGSDANKAEERFQEGNLCYGREDYAGAEAMYREAIILFPHHEKYYKGLGNALVMQGKRKESLEYFDRAIQLNPHYGEGYNARGLTYTEMEDHEKAYQDFRQAVRFTPNDISAWSNLALLHQDLGKKPT